MASPTSSMETLISVYSHRLQSSALQRLSIADILSDGPAFSALQQVIPSREALRISKLQERDYNRLIRFINLHEPTGHERDEEHKRNAVRYIGLRTMLHECSTVKTPNILEACVDKMLEWFGATESEAGMIPSRSTPNLPAKMSPKRLPNHNDTSTSEEMVSQDTGIATQTNNPAELVKHFRQPDLRGSHVRRITGLRSRGQTEDMPVSSMSESNPPLNEDISTSPAKQLDRSRVDATFQLYRPETDVEIEMNLRWLQRRNEDAIVAKKEQELQDHVHKWELDRSRDESEYLRKHESSKLASKLEQIVQCRDHSNSSELLGTSEKYIPREMGKVSFFSKLLPAGPQAISEGKSTSMGNQNVGEPSFAARVVVKPKVAQSTPSKGGMHYRNQLPANFTPTRSMASVASATQIGESKPLTAQYSGDGLGRMLADDPKRSRQIQRGPLLCSDDRESEAEGNIDDKGRTGDAAATRFQSFHDSRLLKSHTSEMSRSEELLGTVPLSHEPADPEYRHLHFARAIRQTVALAREHQDFPQSHVSKASLGSADQAPRPIVAAATPASSRQQKARSSSRASSASTGSKPRSARAKKKTSRSKSPKARPSTTGRVRPPASQSLAVRAAASMSELRREQLDELEKIRRLFEEKQLPFPARALERGLLVPEDRPALQSVRDLPLPGARLPANPLPLAGAARLQKKKRRARKPRRLGQWIFLWAEMELEAENARLRALVARLEARCAALEAESELLADANLALGERLAALERERPAAEPPRVRVPDALLLPAAGLRARELAALEGAHAFGNVLSAAAHRERPLALSGGVDRAASLLDWRQRRKLAALQLEAPVLAVAFGPSAETADLALVACMDATHGLYRVAERRGEWRFEQLRHFRDHTRHGTLRVAWSPSGRLFATGASDKTVNIYRCAAAETGGAGELEGGEQEHATKLKTFYFNGTVEALVFAPATEGSEGAEPSGSAGPETLIISVRDDCYLHYVDCSTLEKERINMNKDGIEHVSYTIMDLRLSPSNKYLLAATDTNRLFIFELRSNTVLRNFYGHKAGPYSQPRAIWHSSEKYVISNTEDSGSIFVWSVASERVVETIEAHEALVRDIAGSCEPGASQVVVTASYDKRVKVWELELEGDLLPY